MLVDLLEGMPLPENLSSSPTCALPHYFTEGYYLRLYEAFNGPFAHSLLSSPYSASLGNDPALDPLENDGLD